MIRNAALFLFVLLTVIAPLPSHAEGVRKWQIVQDGSSIVFKGKQMGSSFEGVFSTFSADISFDDKDLKHSKVEATVDTASLSTKDKERDTNATGKEWFNAEKFPTARFVSSSFRKAEGENAFVADGTLTIKDISIPVSLPFTLVYAKDGLLTMRGNLMLDRSKFLLGTGDWADPSIIANDVAVEIALIATAVQ